MQSFIARDLLGQDLRQGGGGAGNLMSKKPKIVMVKSKVPGPKNSKDVKRLKDFSILHELKVQFAKFLT